MSCFAILYYVRKLPRSGSSRLSSLNVLLVMRYDQLPRFSPCVEVGLLTSVKVEINLLVWVMALVLFYQ